MNLALRADYNRIRTQKNMPFCYNAGIIGISCFYGISGIYGIAGNAGISGIIGITGKTRKGRNAGINGIYGIAGNKVKNESYSLNQS